MAPLRMIEDKSGIVDRCPLLQAALQRWENEGGAGPGRNRLPPVSLSAKPDANSQGLPISAESRRT